MIELSFQSNDDSSNKLLMVCTKYQEAMKLLTSHCELWPDEIESFQTLFDGCF
jgi:hypothetical protein